MNSTARMFYDIGEPFAAGFFEWDAASPARMFCRAYRRFLEEAPLPEYRQDDPFYPYGNLWCDDYAVNPQYCSQFIADYDRLESKSVNCAAIFRDFAAAHGDFFRVEGREAGSRYAAYIDGWNHAAPNFRRIVSEGLATYETHVQAMENADLREALLDLLTGIRTYHGRILTYLESVHAEERLLCALLKVPYAPAESAYEALVSCNFVLCLDGCDNLGFIDGWLPAYWKGEDLTHELRSLMLRILRCGNWSMTIGPVYSGLTKQYLRASEGLARPMIELRTCADMPDDIWEAALERVLSGGGQPAFYNEEAIQRRLRERFPHAPEEDIYEFAGMGCTETNMSGMTLSGGIDVNLNVLKVFDEVMREKLHLCSSFSEFYEAFMTRLGQVQDDLIRFVDQYYTRRSEICFAPIRTLFTDDCISREKGYYSGGPRYTYAIPSDSGIPNTVDSLLVIRELVFEKKMYTPDGFLSALDAQEPRLLGLIRSCPAYGIGSRIADELIHDLTSRFYAHYRHAELAIGDGFLPTSHQFVRHVAEGYTVGHTPDGRRKDTPVADSIAAVNGKAVKGPTLMLKSAAAFDQSMVYAIPVLNLSITRKFSPDVLRSLIEGYFEMGGTQIQITCIDRDTLLEAQRDPDAHRDLIVRVGGYSEYFHRLSRDLQNAVIARTMFES